MLVQAGPLGRLLLVKLEVLGWNGFFREHADALHAPGLVPARVCRDGRDLFHVVGADGELVAALSGKLRHEASSRADLPAVGDWVMVQPPAPGGHGLIRAVLPRRTAISRKAPGSVTDTQIVAANMDTVFVVAALDGGRSFNVRRLERYLSLVRESGAAPAILLNKADLCEDTAPFIAEAVAVANDAPVYALSALQGQGLDALSLHLGRGRTVALIGPSGVGKSALVNALAGEDMQATGEVRVRDRRGRHPTSHRELLPLPGGALIIDNPGLREIQLWGEEDQLSEVFADIEALSGQCHFGNCRHSSEPGCAIQAALADGTLDTARYEHYLKLKEELGELVERKERRVRIEEKRQLRRLHQFVQERQKIKLRGLYPS